MSRPHGSARRRASWRTGRTACCSTAPARRWPGSCPRPRATVTGADPARPPSDLELRGRGPVVALPANLTPVGDLTGRWIPVDDVGDHPAYVEFAADGTWTGSDGCTPTGGSWLAGPDGAFLATARTLMTFVACPGVGVAPQVGAARRIGTEGPR